jgi:uncharacterized coiled-coil protein SlyX
LWCSVCGHEMPNEDEDDNDNDYSDDDDDDDGDGGGKSGRKRGLSPDPDTERRGREEKRRACLNAVQQRIVVGGYSGGYGRDLRMVIEHECKTVLGVADRLCDWVMQVAVADVKVQKYDPVAELKQKTVDIEQTVAVQHNHISELKQTVADQHKVVTDLEKKISTLIADQSKVTSLEQEVARLQSKADRKPSKQKKVVTDFTQFLTTLVMDQMQQPAAGRAGAKSNTAVEHFAQHIARLVAEQQHTA